MWTELNTCRLPSNKKKLYIQGRNYKTSKKLLNKFWNVYVDPGDTLGSENLKPPKFFYCYDVTIMSYIIWLIKKNNIFKNTIWKFRDFLC